MKCQKCGFNMTESAVFCPLCGHSVTEDNGQSENMMNVMPDAVSVPSVKQKSNTPLIIGCVAAGIVLIGMIAVLIILIVGKTSVGDNVNHGNEQTTEAVAENNYKWFKEPFFDADDMCYITDVADYIYNEYTLFYDGRKCGVVDNNGRIVSEPVFSEVVYCEACYGFAFDDYSKVLYFDTGVLTGHAGHGGTFSHMVYDINSNSFMFICGGDGPSYEIDFDSAGTYVVYECRKQYEWQEQYYNYVYTGRVGLYSKGKLTVPFEYELATGISDGIVGMYNGKSWTYFDPAGNVVYENVPVNDDVIEWIKYLPDSTNGAYTKDLTEIVYEFSCGCVPVKQGDKWGYMDKNGEMIINARFEKALPFVDNRAWVCIDGKWGIIEKK